MVRDAVTHRFDQDGFPTAFKRQLSSFLCGCSHRKDVIAVHANSIDTVTDTSTCDTIAAVLFECRGGDGVPVVPADEDDGAGTGCGDVEGGMKVAFASGALAEVTGYDSGGEVGVLEGLEFQSVGCPGGLRDLSRERGGNCVLMNN